MPALVPRLKRNEIRCPIGARVASAAAAIALCTGCPDPNIYGTPRTTPAGKVAHTVAFQFANYNFDNGNQVGDATEDTNTLFPPSYQLRIGVVDTLDVGFRVAYANSLGADVKWNFVKTDIFDMAFAPGIQAWYYDSCSADGGTHGQVYANLPLLFGFNLNESVSFVPTAGITYGCTARITLFGNTPSDRADIRGVMVRGGLGVEFRLSPRFALHPEVTYLNYVDSDSRPAISWLVFGLGLNFGSLPELGSP